MKSKVKSTEKYDMISEEGTQKGTFFRNPIQKYDIDLYDGNISWLYNPLRNPLLFLMNINKIRGWKKFVQEYNAAGIRVKTIASPIYFKRVVKKAKFYFKNHDTVDFVEVFGEEPYKNRCGGACIKEKTKIYWKNGIEPDIIYNEKTFHFIYRHVIEEEFFNK